MHSLWLHMVLTKGSEVTACIFITLSDSLIHNDRYISLKFDVSESSVLHGFSGYFDSILYEDLHMSK